MATAAMAQFQKIMKKCPHCGDDGAKELVSGSPKQKIAWFKAFMLIFCTAGIGFFIKPLYPFWHKDGKSYLEALCAACNKSFHPGKNF
jgi:hypothetical protein